MQISKITPRRLKINNLRRLKLFDLVRYRPVYFLSSGKDTDDAFVFNILTWVTWTCA